jgi:glycerophosphoryl diester phosphodiesterase
MAVSRIALPETFLRPIAHRGLHGGPTACVENTASAFTAAIAATYGIECDLRAAADGVPVVFHDFTLERLIDATGPVSALSASDRSRLRHRGTFDPILTFTEFLTLVAGRTPLLVEIKSEWTAAAPTFLQSIADAASDYGGPIAVMSFDPAILAELGQRAPTVPRGIVSGSYRATSGEDWWPSQLSPRQRQDLREMSAFDHVGASFAAYEVSALATPPVHRLRERSVPVFAWTVRSQADRDMARRFADAPIFEQEAD